MRDRSPQRSEVNDSIFSSSEDETDLSSFDDVIQEDSTNSIALSEKLDNLNDFLPGLTENQDIMENKQPESTNVNMLPTSSIAVLTNAQTAYPLDVKFRAIEDHIKTAFLHLLSSPNTFVTGICMNSFTVNTCIVIF